MTDETREKIALFRYKLISPILAEPGRVQNDYFREQAAIEHAAPYRKRRRVSVSTLKSWLKKYQKGGFAALKPRRRADAGRPRRLDEHAQAAIRMKCKAFPDWSTRFLYEHLKKEELLGQPPICYATLRRMVISEGLLPQVGRKDVRKRFETAHVNDLWIADFMHGPRVRVGKAMKRAILCAIIDDHSRMIVGHAFGPHETISDLVLVLKEAFLAHGLPRRLYVDNGAAFSSDLLLKSCAEARVSLIHSKPYDSPSRGKIERYFRTVRDRFLPHLAGEVTLKELQETYALWLRDQYHHRLHTGIDERPIDRYQTSITKTDIRRLSRAELDEIFLVRAERIVNNDATISFKNNIYEVPSAYIRQKIELRYPIDDPQNLALYDQGVRVAKLNLVDVRENAKVFKPQKVDAPLSFAQGKVNTKKKDGK